jgi:hypothetical protein
MYPGSSVPLNQVWDCWRKITSSRLHYFVNKELDVLLGKQDFTWPIGSRSQMSMSQDFTWPIGSQMMATHIWIHVGPWFKNEVLLDT